MNDKDRIAKGREALAKAAAEAPDETIDKMMQAVNLGSQILDMVDALSKAREAMPKIAAEKGYDPEEADVSIGTQTIMANKKTGDSFLIQMSFASAEEIEEYRKDMENAQELPE